MEFNYDEIYAPVDLGIARCRLAVAAPEEFAAEPMQRLSHLRVATKYPRITRRHFARQGIQAECIKLSGAVELAPAMGLCRRIVDLVSTGATLRANRLVEIEQIADVTARLIVNRAAFKTRHGEIAPWLTRIEEAARGA
jgi:ATP phosphoribosyltransferase